MTAMPRTVKSAIFYSAIGIIAVVGIMLFVVANQTLGTIFRGTADEEESGGGSSYLGGSEPNLGYLINYNAIIAVGEEGTFDAHSKFGEPPFSFEWKFSDGVTLNGQNVTRSFDSPSRYFFTLTITDGTGETVTSSQLNTNVVQNVPEKDASANRTSIHHN
jgi:hypothetical protein